MKIQEKILVLGACGQLGGELIGALKERYGKKSVVASDRLEPGRAKVHDVRYLRIDVTNRAQVQLAIAEESPTQVYLLAAVLSANGEREPALAWGVNMDGLLNVLDLSVRYGVQKVFWPSSIAVFGPDSPKVSCPQQAYSVPATVYGISKLAGEYWCSYYFERHGLDVRSLRYPGLISYRTPPGGGTTDYAVDIFHKAKAGEEFTCFLEKDTVLPMMYMDDAVRATLELMEAPRDSIRVRGSYNIAGTSFSPRELAEEIRKGCAGFRIGYAPDFRQQIADSWPASIDDSGAQEDWGWRPGFSLADIVREMMGKVRVASAAAKV